MKSKWKLELDSGLGVFIYQRYSDEDLPTLVFESDKGSAAIDSSEALMLKRILEAFLGDVYGN
jgi:hypothetical protein